MFRRTAVAAAASLAGLVTVASACTSNDASTDAADSTSTQTSDPTTTSGPTAPHLTDGPATPLAAGTYQFSMYPIPGVEVPDAVVEVPNGFDDEAAWYVVSPDQQEFLGLWTGALVDRDACHVIGDGSFDPGPSVKDLAHALVAQKSTRATAPQPVTVDGHRGLYVELHSPADIGGCDPESGLWGGRSIFNDGQVDLVWILDVGGQRVMVDAAYTPKSSASDIDKLTSMVESIEFVVAAQEITP